MPLELDEPPPIPLELLLLELDEPDELDELDEPSSTRGSYEVQSWLHEATTSGMAKSGAKCFGRKERAEVFG